MEANNKKARLQFDEKEKNQQLKKLADIFLNK